MSGLCRIASAIIASKLLESTGLAAFRSAGLTGSAGFGCCPWPNAGAAATSATSKQTLRIRIAFSPIGFELHQKPIVGSRIGLHHKCWIEIEGIAVAAHGGGPVVE